MGEAMIGGILVIPLVLGIVEFAKNLGLQGRACQVLAVVLGAFFIGLSQAIQMGLIPEIALPWISVVVFGIGGGMATVGLYDYSKRFQS